MTNNDYMLIKYLLLKIESELNKVAGVTGHPDFDSFIEQLKNE